MVSGIVPANYPDLLMLSFAASSAAARAGKSGGNTASAMAQLYVYEAAEQCASSEGR